MRTRATAALRSGATIFARFTPGQKAVTVVTVVALVVGGFLFTRWASQPDYSPLFSNLSSTDASAIVEELDKAGVPYKLAAGGNTILVAKDQVYDERVKLAGKGLPNGDQNGWSLMDKQGVTTSDFQQQVTYQRALEGELAKTISAIDGVQQSVVHLALPQKDVFTDDETKPTASVLVAVKPGGELTRDQVQAVVNLVSASVPNLEPDNVTVADSNGSVLSAAGEQGTLGQASGERVTQSRAYEEKLSTSLQQMLDNVVGPAHSVVRVTADLDYDQTTTTTERYVSDPKNPPLAQSQTKETLRGSGTSVGGVLGPDNIQVPSGTAGGANAYDKTTTTQDNAVGKVVEQRKAAPGAVRKLGVAIVIDSNAARGVAPNTVSGLVSAALGINAARGDTLQVSALPFDETKAKQQKSELAQAKKAEARKNLISMIKAVGLGLVVLVLLVLTFLSSRRKKREELDLADLERLDHEAMQAIEGDQVAALESGDGYPAALEPVPADPQDAHLAEVRDEVAQMVAGQPDEVAAVLRGWLADRRS